MWHYGRAFRGTLFPWIRTGGYASAIPPPHSVGVKELSLIMKYFVITDSTDTSGGPAAGGH